MFLRKGLYYFVKAIHRRTMRFRRPRLRVSLIVGLVIFLAFLILDRTLVRVFVRDAIYLVRPIWDKPGRHPQIVIPHFYAEHLEGAVMCGLHNWTLRPPSAIPSVIDTVIFSSETDMLEIRLKELWDVVDKFVILESNLTFTGKPKPLYFAEERHRFQWAEKKILYFTFNKLEQLPDGETPFFNEGKTRGHLGHLIRSSNVGAKSGDLVIESDVDEIPSAKTIRLLKSCQGYPDGLHLEMKNYAYSFEFYLDRLNWKPKVRIYEAGTFTYHHQWSSNYVLADAGWHCSFCFRYLSQFVFKMEAFSHTDRVTSQKLLVKENIQEKICRGADIFDMYPEGYTFRELIAKMGDIPKTDSTINIPEYVVVNAERFKFLLPGGCMREDSSIK